MSEAVFSVDDNARYQVCKHCGFFFYLCSCASGDRVVWKGRYTRVVRGVRPGRGYESHALYYLEHFDSSVRPHRFVWTYAFSNKKKAIAAARDAEAAVRSVSATEAP